MKCDMIKIDDKSLLDLGFEVLAHQEDDAIYEFEANTYKVIGRHGLYKAKDRINTRKLEVVLFFDSKDNEHIDEKIEELNSLFFDIKGQRKLVKVEMEYWRDRHMYGYINTPEKIERDNYHTEITLEIIFYDPFKYSNELVSLTGQFGANDINWGSTTVTFADPYTFAYQSMANATPLEIEINNLGIITYPEIIISGSADSLTISANGNSITVPKFTREARITRFISYLDSRETFVKANNFYLMPGKNTITVSGTNANITIEFKVRETYK